MKSVGIDIGTTTISAVVIDASDLTVVQKHTFKHKGFLPTEPPWIQIQDAQEMIGKAKAMLGEGRLGENFQSGMVHGKQYTAAFGNSGTWVYSKRSFKPCPS